MGQYLDHLVGVAKSELDSYYVIARERDDHMWYLFDIDDSTSTLQIMWTKSPTTCFKFPTKETADAFNEAYIPSPSYVFIQRAKNHP